MISPVSALQLVSKANPNAEDKRPGGGLVYSVDDTMHTITQLASRITRT